MTITKARSFLVYFLLLTLKLSLADDSYRDIEPVPLIKQHNDNGKKAYIETSKAELILSSIQPAAPASPLPPSLSSPPLPPPLPPAPLPPSASPSSSQLPTPAPLPPPPAPLPSPSSPSSSPPPLSQQLPPPLPPPPPPSSPSLAPAPALPISMPTTVHAPLSDGIEDTHASDDSEHYSDSNGDDGDSAVTGNEDNDDDSNNYSNDDDNEGDERDDDNRDEIDEIEEEDGNDSHDSTDEIDEIDNADIKAPIVDVSIEEAATIVAHALVDAVTRPEIDAAIAATDEIKASDHLLSGMENPPSLPTPLLRDATVDTNTVHDGAADRIESVPLVQNPSVADAIANFKSPTPVHEDKVEESLENANDPGERELTPEEEEKEPIVQEKQYNHFVQRAIDHKRGGQNLGKGEGKPIPTVDVLESLEVEVLEDEYFNVGPKASEEDAIAQKVQAEIDARIYHEIVHKLKPHEINRHNKKHENVASMFPHMFHLLQFAFISFSSTHIGNLFKNWGLPIISGYLFAGMLAGPYILNVLTQPAIMDLRVIDQSSLAVICFAAGAELNFAELRPHLRSILWIMGSLMTCTFCVTFLAVIVLSDWIEFQDGMSASGHLAIAVLISTVLIARSPASAIAIVKDLGADGPFAKICVGVSVAIDVVLIVLFSLNMELSISILHNKAFELASILHPLMSIVWSVVAGGCLTLLFTPMLAQPRYLQFPLLVLIGLIPFTYAPTLAHTFGIHLEPLLVSVIAGIYMTNFSRRGLHFTHLLERVMYYVNIAFFTSAGAELALDTMLEPSTVMVGSILFLMRLCALYLGAAGGGYMAGRPQAENDIAWMAYVTQAGVAMGLARDVALEFPIWGPDFASMVISVMVLNQIAGPVLFKYSLSKLGETGGQGSRGKRTKSDRLRADEFTLRTSIGMVRQKSSDDALDRRTYKGQGTYANDGVLAVSSGSELELSDIEINKAVRRKEKMNTKMKMKMKMKMKSAE